MAETTFENAKVGDRVWSPLCGWGIIILKTDNLIEVNPDYASGTFLFYHDGRFYAFSVAPSLFWSEVQITPPERPKRKVKKVVERWGTIDPDGNFHTTCATKKVAEALWPGYPTFKMTGEYEVEE